MNKLRRLSFLTLSLFLAGTGFAQDTATEREFVRVPQTAALNLPFADAVKVGNTLYISGRGGLDFETTNDTLTPAQLPPHRDCSSFRHELLYQL